jgi:hypothetical protein
VVPEVDLHTFAAAHSAGGYVIDTSASRMSTPPGMCQGRGSFRWPSCRTREEGKVLP